MSIIKTLRTLLGNKASESSDIYQVTANSEGLLYATAPELFSAFEKAQKTSLQHTVLKMLVEQGLAKALPNGFLLPKEVVSAQLGDSEIEDIEIANILAIEPRQKLKFTAQARSFTTQKDFSVSLFVELAEHGQLPVEFRGPYIKLPGNRHARLNTGELLGLEAWQQHQELTAEQRSELQNLRLIAQLQLAKDSGMDIDLKHFEQFIVKVPESIGVHVHRNSDGSLTLRPSIDSLTNEQLESRWGQVIGSQDSGALRVENTIVLLDEKKRQAIDEVFKNQHIPKEQVKNFIENPSAFLDASLIDLDVGFSTRVTGIGELVFLSFGELDSEKTDWFSDGLTEKQPIKNLEAVIKCPEDLQRFEEQYKAARASNATVMRFDGESIDISDSADIAQQLENLETRYAGGEYDGGESTKPDASDKEETGSAKRWTLLLETAEEKNKYLLELASREFDSNQIDWQACLREPYPHQRKGVEWAISLISQAVAQSKQPVRIEGALLADDMGLGKTYMSLVAINEYYRLLEQHNKTLKPILVVAPLSLLDNWKDEVAVTFKESPFTDIQILQSGKDLNKFRVAGVDRESVQLTEQMNGREDSDQGTPEIKYALHVGQEAGLKRLDMPGRLVVTTYDTLRSYQFSLCKVDWGLVFFDEAQNIKNPNTLQTRAAKALKADFKMLVTGTPVENSLADFWCLLDTAQPGLLGDWSVFRQNWVTPIVQAAAEEKEAKRIEIGEQLRQATGAFMLRRTKEEELPGLPVKRSFVGKQLHKNADNTELLEYLGQDMRGAQLKEYDGILSGYQQQVDSLEKGVALTALAALRNISLHPRLQSPSTLNMMTANQGQEFLSGSAKLIALKQVLDQIQAKSEKVIIFVINKRLQLMLKQALDALYNLKVDVINGDTKTVESSSGRESATRKSMIKQFEAKPGFNIIIMSPIAAGVGLTIVGANHVIHLERHWNPAKEAQATDRVYRIGQEKDVCIYYPFSLHPSKQSFDEHLALLLDRKHLLKEAVVTSEPVKEADVIRGMFS
ncbi:MAG: DEAD/DEAH box helicase [Gammaproteobacteria bacterium]|nr:DEAD/DEAH box helicase [Gammaproteobacteria bacterium]